MDAELPLLPSRERYLRQRADHETVHGVSWQNRTNSRTRRLIYAAFEESYPNHHVATGLLTQGTVSGIFDEGTELEHHVSSSFQSACSGDLFGDLCPEDEFLDWLQASALALRQLADSLNGTDAEDGEYSFQYAFDYDTYIRKVNDILLDRRINFTFLDGVIRERGSEPLHLEIIQPVEAAITSDERFAAVEEAYKQASHSLATGQYGASITAIGSALQETFRALGVEGQTLAAQFSAARRENGLLHTVDEKLFDAYKKIGDWITATRSVRGNAHGAATAEREDAELAVHVIASLIIRLVQISKTTPRNNG
jgi:hypothetical protein